MVPHNMQPQPSPTFVTQNSMSAQPSLYAGYPSPLGSHYHVEGNARPMSNPHFGPELLFQPFMPIDDSMVVYSNGSSEAAHPPPRSSDGYDGRRDDRSGSASYFDRSYDRRHALSFDRLSSERGQLERRNFGINYFHPEAPRRGPSSEYEVHSSTRDRHGFTEPNRHDFFHPNSPLESDVGSKRTNQFPAVRSLGSRSGDISEQPKHYQQEEAHYTRPSYSRPPHGRETEGTDKNTFPRNSGNAEAFFFKNLQHHEHAVYEDNETVASEKNARKNNNSSPTMQSRYGIPLEDQKGVVTDHEEGRQAALKKDDVISMELLEEIMEDEKRNALDKDENVLLLTSKIPKVVHMEEKNVPVERSGPLGDRHGRHDTMKEICLSSLSETTTTEVSVSDTLGRDHVKNPQMIFVDIDDEFVPLDQSKDVDIIEDDEYIKGSSPRRRKRRAKEKKSITQDKNAVIENEASTVIPKDLETHSEPLHILEKRSTHFLDKDIFEEELKIVDDEDMEDHLEEQPGPKSNYLPQSEKIISKALEVFSIERNAKYDAITCPIYLSEAWKEKDLEFAKAFYNTQRKELLDKACGRPFSNFSGDDQPFPVDPIKAFLLSEEHTKSPPSDKVAFYIASERKFRVSLRRSFIKNYCYFKKKHSSIPRGQCMKPMKGQSTTTSFLHGDTCEYDVPPVVSNLSPGSGGNRTTPFRTLRHHPSILKDVVHSEDEYNRVLMELIEIDRSDPTLRWKNTEAVVPPMNLTDEICWIDENFREHNPVGRFISHSSLQKAAIVDRCSVDTLSLLPYGAMVGHPGDVTYTTTTGCRPFSKEEVNIYMEKYLHFPKRFDIIWKALPSRSYSEIIQYYYENKKKHQWKKWLRISSYSSATSSLASSWTSRKDSKSCLLSKESKAALIDGNVKTSSASNSPKKEVLSASLPNLPAGNDSNALFSLGSRGKRIGRPPGKRISNSNVKAPTDKYEGPDANTGLLVASPPENEFDRVPEAQQIFEPILLKVPSKDLFTTKKFENRPILIIASPMVATETEEENIRAGLGNLPGSKGEPTSSVPPNDQVSSVDAIAQPEDSKIIGTQQSLVNVDSTVRSEKLPTLSSFAPDFREANSTSSPRNNNPSSYLAYWTPLERMVITDGFIKYGKNWEKIKDLLTAHRETRSFGKQSSEKFCVCVGPLAPFDADSSLGTRKRSGDFTFLTMRKMFSEIFSDKEQFLTSSDVARSKEPNGETASVSTSNSLSVLEGDSSRNDSVTLERPKADVARPKESINLKKRYVYVNTVDEIKLFYEIYKVLYKLTELSLHSSSPISSLGAISNVSSEGKKKRKAVEKKKEEKKRRKEDGDSSSKSDVSSSNVTGLSASGLLGQAPPVKKVVLPSILHHPSIHSMFGPPIMGNGPVLGTSPLLSNHLLANAAVMTNNHPRMGRMVLPALKGQSTSTGASLASSAGLLSYDKVRMNEYLSMKFGANVGPCVSTESSAVPAVPPSVNAPNASHVPSSSTGRAMQLIAPRPSLDTALKLDVERAIRFESSALAGLSQDRRLSTPEFASRKASAFGSMPRLAGRKSSEIIKRMSSPNAIAGCPSSSVAGGHLLSSTTRTTSSGLSSSNDFGSTRKLSHLSLPANFTFVEESTAAQTEDLVSNNGLDHGTQRPASATTGGLGELKQCNQDGPQPTGLKTNLAAVEVADTGESSAANASNPSLQPRPPIEHTAPREGIHGVSASPQQSSTEVPKMNATVDEEHEVS